MLDDIIRRSILERERKKKQWQPEPLYLPVDDYVPLPIKTPEKVPDDEIKRGIIIIETAGYNSVNDKNSWTECPYICYLEND